VYASSTTTAIETLKFSAGKLSIRKVDASATGVSEEMRKCSTAGIGSYGSNAGVLWNSGSHNQVAGTANTGADSAKEYKDHYLDCATVTTVGNRGYTVRVTAAKVLSSVGVAAYD